MSKACIYCKAQSCRKVKCAIENCTVKLKECCLQRGKYCINCAVAVYHVGEENIHKVLNYSYCQYCYKVIGNLRLNGVDHDDWEKRRFHKACYKLWIQEGNM